MRLQLLLILLMLPVLVWAKEPPTNTKAKNGIEQYRLFDGNLLLNVPEYLQKAEEYQHFWDQCSGGGYTVFFTSPESTERGMKLQVNIHDRNAKPKHIDSWYNPNEQKLANSFVVQDTSFNINGKQYRSFATLHKGKNPLLKKGRKTWNYNLSYYVMADGHMLEFHYFYWDKKDADLSYWQQTANQIARDMQWHSRGWASN